MADIVALERALSAGRLEPYVKAAGGGLAEGIQLYEWNTAVSAAFFEVLGHFEVVLRNALHEQLRVLGGREDWWLAPRFDFTPPANDMIAKACAEMGRRCASGSPGHVVAALPFGFWVALLSAGGDCNYEMSLWRPGLRQAFPGYSGTRARLHPRLNTLRLLRNRIAHHEPIYRRHLAADHDTVLEVVGWTVPGFANWMRQRSRVPNFLAQRPFSAEPPCD
ncbi:hypothetical protein [Micromonospora gifhornensis]|uniref:hypothetical protein n=1 Tax=Micromonospora gifhornensis TaxID=84594 RepID=UPI003D75C7BD